MTKIVEKERNINYFKKW